MAQIIDIKTGAVHDFEKEKRIREILDKAQKTGALESIVKNQFSEAHILEEEAYTSDGEHVVLFSISGRDDIEGLAVEKRHLLSGEINLNDVYIELAKKLVEGEQCQ